MSAGSSSTALELARVLVSVDTVARPDLEPFLRRLRPRPRQLVMLRIEECDPSLYHVGIKILPGSELAIDLSSIMGDESHRILAARLAELTSELGPTISTAAPSHSTAVQLESYLDAVLTAASLDEVLNERARGDRDRRGDWH